MEKPTSQKPSQKESVTSLTIPELSQADAIGLIVHSYNNYLSAMMGFSELALLDEQAKDKADRISEVIRSGEQAVEFGKELLSALSRIQLRAIPLTVSRLLQHLSERFSIPIAQFDEEGNKTVSVALDLNWFTHCIEKTIRFCQNYSPELSDLHISAWIDAEETKKCLLLEMSKPGMELAKKVAERIAQPFFTSRQLLGQKDVGLAVVSGYIKQLGGEFFWSNKEKAFVVRLPLSKSDP